MLRTWPVPLSIALVLVACSDDGVTQAAGTSSGGGDGGQPVTSQPPNWMPEGSGDDGGESTGGTSDAPPPGTTGPGAQDGTDTGNEAGTGTTGTTTEATGSSTGGTGGAPVTPAAGDLVISEIMQNPAVLMDDEGEWFELHNPSATTAYQLQGCTIEGTMVDAGFTIDAELVVAPGEYLIFATAFAGDQGFTADLQWDAADFQLNNATDTVRLRCDGAVIDEVTYDNGATFPDPNGASMSLDPGSLDATANDDGTNWCEATTAYNGDLGTPGAPNDDCG